MFKLRPIPGFKTLKVAKHGRWWYIIDVATQSPIGGYHETKGDALDFAERNYTGQYT